MINILVIGASFIRQVRNVFVLMGKMIHRKLSNVKTKDPFKPNFDVGSVKY